MEISRVTIWVNVESRLVWGSLIVRSFAEIIQHPPRFVWGPLIVQSCAAGKKKMNSEKKIVEQVRVICFEMHGKQ